MAIPSSYTEVELQDYMLEITSAISSVIGLVSSDFTEAVNDTLVNYGVNSIASATNIKKLRLLAKIEAWRTVVNVTVAEYDQSRDSGESQVWDKKNQLHTNAKAQLEAAETQAASLGYVADGATYNTVAFGTITYNDPYSITEDEE